MLAAVGGGPLRRPDLGGMAGPARWQGTPRVQEFCLGEIALARGTGVTATMNAAADALDWSTGSRQTWKVCLAGGADLHIARRVAKLSRHLPATRSRWWTVRWPGSSPRGRWPGPRGRGGQDHRGRPGAARGAGRDRTAAALRVVLAHREFGLRTVIARVEAGDAVWVEAIVARVAEIITPRYPEATADELRSIAFGWLARPAELLQLLLEHRDEPEELDLDSKMRRLPAGRRRSRPTCSTLFARSTCHRWPEGGALRPPPRSRHPRDARVARVEGLGPVTLTRLQACWPGLGSA